MACDRPNTHAACVVQSHDVGVTQGTHREPGSGEPSISELKPSSAWRKSGPILRDGHQMATNKFHSFHYREIQMCLDGLRGKNEYSHSSPAYCRDCSRRVPMKVRGKPSVAQSIVSWFICDRKYRVHAIKAIGRRKGRIFEVEEVETGECFHGSFRRLERWMPILQGASREPDQAKAWEPNPRS